MSNSNEPCEGEDPKPDHPAATPRAPRNLLGIVFVADDFDDPLPPLILSAFEGEA